jgi:hypothetical protein
MNASTTFLRCVESLAAKTNAATRTLSLGLATLVCFLFANSFAHGDTIYVSNYDNSTIEKFDSSGNGTLFASTGLNSPTFIAIQIPVPATCLLVLGGIILVIDQRFSRRKSALLLCIVFGFSFSVRAELLDFNTPAVRSQDGYGVGESYIEDGFRFQPVGDPASSIIRFNPKYLPGELPNNGTPYFGATYSSVPRMDRADGALFTINQIDLSRYAIDVPCTNVTFRGNKSNGGYVTTKFVIPSWNGSFYTFQFGSEWTDLQSIDFLTQTNADYVTQPFAWDNIVVVTIPEPTTCRLLALGAIALLGGRRLYPRKPTQNS